MEKSILLSLAGLLCLWTQVFGAVVPVQEEQNYDNVTSHEQSQAIQETDMEKRTVHKQFDKLWPKGVVNYQIECDVFSDDLEDKIRKALAEISHYTCVTFQESRTLLDRVYVTYWPHDGCSSTIGKAGGVQKFNLGLRCANRRGVLREFLHAVGLGLEQNRPDRDQYVTIHLENVDAKDKSKFDKYDQNEFFSYFRYDYHSVMHDSGTAFSNNGKPTIVTKDSLYQNTIGNNPRLSMYDIRTINMIYGCTPSSCALTWKDCGPKGWVGKNCRCWCPGPSKTHPVEYCLQKDITELGSLEFKK